MIKKLAFLLLLCHCFLGYSQEKPTNPDRRFGVAFSPGVIIQRNVFAEANLFLGQIVTEFGPKVPAVGNYGFRIGLETDGNRTIAPKIGYEIAATMVTIRLSAANYFQDGNSEFRLIPEFGFCIGGWVNLTYGSGISLNNGHLTDIGHHRVCLSFNLNKRLGKAAWKLVENPNK